MAVPTFVAAGTRGVGIGDVTPGLPAGWAEDDIFLLVCESSDAVVAAPTGYAAVADSPQSEATGPTVTRTTLTIFWKRAIASESDPTVTDPGDHCIAQILAFRGCITTGDPWDVTAGDTTGGTASASVSIPGDTTTVADCLIVAACAAATDTDTAEFSAWANADLATVTERTDEFVSLGNGGGFGVATGEKATAGAFGATTATLVTSSKQGRIMVALKPAAVAGDQTVTGVLLTVAPSFPVGSMQVEATIGGVLLSVAPSFPQGSLQAVSTITGALLTVAPSFPQGSLASETTVGGVLLTVAPIFPTGSIDLEGAQTITGILLTVAPTFPQGSVQAEATIAGVLLMVSPSFPIGSVSGAGTITGLLLSVAPIFPQGSMDSTATTTGVLLTVAPIFPQGSVDSMTTVSGVLLSVPPVFPQGSVALSVFDQTVTGILLAVSPSFPIGSLSGGAPPVFVTVVGVVSRSRVSVRSRSRVSVRRR